jgi:hypothetical protein
MAEIRGSAPDALVPQKPIRLTIVSRSRAIQHPHRPRDPSANACGHHLIRLQSFVENPVSEPSALALQSPLLQQAAAGTYYLTRRWHTSAKLWRHSLVKGRRAAEVRVSRSLTAKGTGPSRIPVQDGQKPFIPFLSVPSSLGQVSHGVATAFHLQYNRRKSLQNAVKLRRNIMNIR